MGWRNVWKDDYIKNDIRLLLNYCEYDPCNSYIEITNGQSILDLDYRRYRFHDGPNFEIVKEMLADDNLTLEKVAMVHERLKVLEALDRMS